MKIVKTDAELELPLAIGALQQEVQVVHLPAHVPSEQLRRELHDADCLLMCYEPITRYVLAEAKQLKGIVKFGVGVDAIDFAACKELEIPIVNVPDYATHTVAEAAFALMIALAKRHKRITRLMLDEGWAWPKHNVIGSDLHSKTLGLVGLGKIGRAMARMARDGFAMRVIGYDPNVSIDVMQEFGVEKFEYLDDLLRISDYVSLHAVLNEQTHHLLSKDRLAMLKSSCCLINVSRGALVDEEALADCLVNGRIAGAGLDVFSNEPLSKSGKIEGRLYDLDNVLLTSHLAFYTAEAMQRLEEETLARVREILHEEPILVSSNDKRLRAQTAKNIKFV